MNRTLLVLPLVLMLMLFLTPGCRKRSGSQGRGSASERQPPQKPASRGSGERNQRQEPGAGLARIVALSASQDRLWSVAVAIPQSHRYLFLRNAPGPRIKIGSQLLSTEALMSDITAATIRGTLDAEPKVGDAIYLVDVFNRLEVEELSPGVTAAELEAARRAPPPAGSAESRRTTRPH